jgi:glycosyltransferase involved in cell wall biosynthesis
MIVHLSNLRPVKRIDRLLDAVALVRPREAFKLVILAGGDFAPFAARVRELGLGDRVVVRPSVFEIEDYLQAADLALFTSDSESFCLGILEAMWFGCPSVSTAVGGIPEVVETGRSGCWSRAASRRRWRARWRACWAIRRAAGRWAEQRGAAHRRNSRPPPSCRSTKRSTRGWWRPRARFPVLH